MSSQEVWGGGAQTQQQTLGVRGQPVTLVLSTGGDPPRGLWAPSLGRRAERKLYTTQHHRGAGARICGECSKVPATCCLWSGAVPVSLSPPGARSSSPSLLGPAGKVSRTKCLLPGRRGPPVLKGWQKRRTQLLSVRSRGAPREIWALREKGREMLWSPS